MTVPVLVVVTGPAGSGKTSLAYKLAEAIRCPAISRDEIKEGMAFGKADFVPGIGDQLTKADPAGVLRRRLLPVGVRRDSGR